MPPSERAEDALRATRDGLGGKGDDRRGPRTGRLLAAGAVLAVAATVLLTSMLATRPTPDSAAGLTPDTMPSGAPGPGSVPGASAGAPVAAPTREVTVSEAQRAPENPAAERPRSVTLPDGAALPVDVAPTRPDGVLGVPEGTGAAGWWDGSSRLGEPFGAIVIAAHVDSTEQGLGPFAQLLGVGRGDPVVLSSESLSQRFRVRSLEVIPRDSLTGHPELTAATGEPRLVLVTCAGPYDPVRGGYQNLAVVTAEPTGPPDSPGG